VTPDLDDDEPKKPSRATIIRRVLVGLLALACAGGWVYTRWIVKKGTLGEPCSYDMHCRAEAPRCLKESTEGDGVCSRPCDTDGDCAPDIKCVKVELDERDERGRPLEGGYCFPQALLDARKKKKNPDAAAPKTADSWVDVPELPDQLEGEVVLERGGSKSSYKVKGTLVLVQGAKGHRTIVDTTTLRVYSVDDEKKTFAASQIGSSQAEATVTKTERKDRVADRECEIWIVEDSGGKNDKRSREACVVRGAAFVDPNARAATAWEKELAVRGVFPLRIVENDKTKLLATKVDTRPLEASLFTIPKAYKNLAAR
jgi:hypothetical protein